MQGQKNIRKSLYYSLLHSEPAKYIGMCCKIKSFGRLNALIMSEGYCKLLLSSRSSMCVSAVACSGSVQVLSVDPASHFHTVCYKFTTQGYVLTS